MSTDPQTAERLAAPAPSSRVAVAGARSATSLGRCPLSAMPLAAETKAKIKKNKSSFTIPAAASCVWPQPCLRLPGFHHHASCSRLLPLNLPCLSALLRPAEVSRKMQFIDINIRSLLTRDCLGLWPQPCLGPPGFHLRDRCC